MRTTALKHKPVTVWDHRGLPAPDLGNLSFHNYVSPTAEEEDECAREFYQWAEEAQREQAKKLRARGYTVTIGPIDWVSPVQGWISGLLGWDNPGVSPDSSEPLEARKIALTLELPAGSPKDAVKVAVETRIVHNIDHDGEAKWYEFIDAIALTVYADGRFYPGIAECSGGSEMDITLVALQRDPPAEVGERVMRVLIGIEGFSNDWPAPLYAALKPMNKCQACGRKLDDPVSRVLQLGPTCASHLGLEHSQRMAESVIRYRRQRGAT